MAEEGSAQAGMISTGQATRLLMLTEARLRQLAGMGYFPKAVKGKYPLVAVVQGYIRFLKDEERRTSKVQAESGLKAARQREVELRIAEREGRLVEMADVEAIVTHIFGKFRANLDGVPASVTRDRELREAIAKGINECFARSEKAFRDACEAIRAGRDPIGAADKNDA
jgi:Phage DNA packaging protein Nu1.